MGSVAPQSSSEALVEARAHLLVAEYTWVAGLVRYYREVELKALAGTGLILSGVGAAYAALAASDNEKAIDRAGMVFALAAMITAFVLPVVLMANLRGFRAVSYVREWQHPLAAELARDPRFLAWEAAANELFEVVAAPSRTLRPLLRAVVVVVLIGAASLSLAVLAWTVETSFAARAIATPAAVCDLVLVAAGLRMDFGKSKHEKASPPQQLAAYRRAERFAKWDVP